MRTMAEWIMPENLLLRLATLDELSKTTIPAFLSPVPCRETLRDWFDAARIPRFKSNPTAKRGGGPVFYSVSAVENFSGLERCREKWRPHDLSHAPRPARDARRLAPLPARREGAD